MPSRLDVKFRGHAHDPSIEAAIQRWIARFESMGIDVHHARITVEPSGRRRTMVSLTMASADRTSRTATTVHADAYVAVADAFRSLRRQLLVASPHMRARFATLAR